MFAPFEWIIAWRYLGARRRERFISIIGWLSLVGIALGVATLIVVMSVMNGFRQELFSRIIGLNSHIHVQGFREGLSDFDSLAAKIKKLEGVAQVRPSINGQVLVTAADFGSGAAVRGIRPEDLRQYKIIAEGGMRGGDLNLFEGEDAVIMGEELARRLGIFVGDIVTLISPQGTATPFGTAPRMRGYQVVGLFNVGMYEYDSNFIFMPLEEAQIYFRLPGRVSGLDVLVHDPDAVASVRADILEVVDQPAQTLVWQEIHASYFNALQTERNVMFVILVMIILVAVFNIMSSLIMLVKDKRRDIAVLRTMGANRGSVMRVFFIAGAFLGLVGSILGVILGFLLLEFRHSILGFFERVFGITFFPPDVYFLSGLPAAVEPMEIMTTVLVALGFSFLATLYPSWRAARLDPVEALRYE
jgi:lipoprotein-releasing system permease protein